MAEEETEERNEMSFLGHLEELRWHLMRSIIAIAVVAVAAFLAKGLVFDTLILGPQREDFPTYRLFCWLSETFNLGDALCIGKPKFELINIEMSGQFTTHLLVSAVLGLVVAFPYIMYELWKFIKPALYDTERKHATGAVFFTSILFLMGISFGYFMIAPLSVNFLGNYQVSESVFNQISLGSYISTITTLTLLTGIVFELPIIMYFLSRVGIVTPQFLRQYRKHALVVLLVLSAIITPPDVTSQILVCIPLLILYEVSIYISASVIKRMEKEANS